MERKCECFRIDNAQIIKVIQVTLDRGTGTDDDPIRRVLAFFSLDGKFLGEGDLVVLKE